MAYQIYIALCFLLINPVFSIEKMIYGKDDRYEASQYPLSNFRVLARSTAAAINEEIIIEKGFGRYTIDALPLEDEMNLCSGNRFAKQPVAASCTGVLIAKDKILTAGHCVSDMEACHSVRWIFGYEYDSEIISNRQIYSCNKILAREIDPYTQLDYAIIQLDRSVSGRQPVSISKKDNVRSGDEMLAIGHPSGLPLKISDQGFVRKENLGDIFFQTSLDTFIFSSGSPVYDKETAKLQGILVRGDHDYLYDYINDCTMLNRNTQDGGRGEDVIKISAIPNLESFLD